MPTTDDTETAKYAATLLARYNGGELNVDQVASVVAAKGSTALAARVVQVLFSTGKIQAACAVAERLEMLDPA